MTPEKPEPGERKPQPPSWWQAPPQQVRMSPPDPPITHHVVLPEKVAVKYLVEVSGQDLNTILSLMRELRIIVEPSRSVDFQDAAKILGRYGIGAEKAA